MNLPAGRRRSNRRAARRARWLFVIVLLGGIGGLAGVWYAAAGDSNGGEPAFGGVYVEGVAGAPQRINPLFAGLNDVDESLVSLIFAGLTRLDDHGKAFPDLAETWNVSADGRTFTFRLRQGLVWQDGAPLTAEDVVFTYEVLRSPGLRTPPPLSRLLAEATITQVDSLTVSFELAQAFAPLPSYLTLGILPAHILENTAPSGLFDAPFNQQPLGAGPYRLDELNSERAVLVANPAFHFGQPYIQRLELRFYRDESLLLAGLRAKEVRAAFFRSRLSESDLIALQRRRDLRLTRLPTGETAYVYLNLRKPLFEDRRVRQALLYAIDREALIRDVLGGQALVADSPVTPGSWAHSPTLERYAPDAEIAGLLLDEAGWRKDGRGVRLKDGSELAFTLRCTSDPLQVALAQAVAQRWTELGVGVTVVPTGTTTLVRDILEPRSYEAALFVHAADADPDPYPAWHSTQTAAKAGNLALLNDDRVDRILQEARLNATTPRRAELYADFQELFAQEVPSIPLYASTALYVQGASLRGVRAGLLDGAGDRFWQVQQWYLKTR